MVRGREINGRALRVPRPVALPQVGDGWIGRLPLPRSVRPWSLTTLWEKLIKIRAKVVLHAKYVTFEVAEIAVPRERLAAIFDRIERFGVPVRLWRVVEAFPANEPSNGREGVPIFPGDVIRG